MNDNLPEQHGPAFSERRAMLAGLGGLAAGALLASTANAGPLTPPPGPIASTPGPEPRIPINQTNTPGDANSTFRITQPGSYYLTGDVVGESGKNGIVIASSNVSLDLNGFAVVGVDGAMIGIATEGARNNLIVCNGIVVSWTDGGINLTASGSGSNAVIENIVVSNNGAVGMQLPFNTTATSCIAQNIFGVGFSSTSTVVLKNCIARNNTGGGFSVGNGSVLTGCSARLNTGGGIVVTGGCLVDTCSAIGNIGNGIVIGSGSRAIGCTAEGILSGNGFASTGPAVIAFCSMSNNQIGASLSAGSTLHDCAAQSCTSTGIVARDRCILRHNTCTQIGSGSSATAIFIAGSDCLIEANMCSGHAIGIQATQPGNFLTRNVCSGNSTNWNIVTGNKCLVVNGIDSGTIIGNSGGTSPGSTDPNANFTY